MRQFLTVPNLVTSGNLAAGFLALLAARTNVVVAAALVVLAAVFDALDGTLARRGAADSAFGGNLDSLADLVSFGVVPAMALYWGPFEGSPVIGAVMCLAFVLCGAWRLARFPLVKSSDGFVGLPIPVAGVLVMVLLLPGPPRPLTVIATAGLSALMLSTVRFPTLGSAGRRATMVAARPLKVRAAVGRAPLVRARLRPRLPSRAHARLPRGRRRHRVRTARHTDAS